MIVWLFFRTLLLLISGLLLMVLLVPFEYRFSGCRQKIYSLQGQIHWLWGAMKASIEKTSAHKLKISFYLFGFRFSPPTFEGKRKKENEQAHQRMEKKTKKKKRKLSPKSFLSRELLEKMLAFSREVFIFLKPKYFRAEARIGFEDPYYTALFWGIFCMAHPILSDFDLQITPVFEDAQFEGSFEIQGRMVLGQLVFLAVKLMLSKPMRNIIKNLKEEKAYVI